MAFTIRKLKNRPWPVTVRMKVCADNGEVTEIAETFIAHWKPFDEAEFKAIVDSAEATLPPPAEGQDQPMRDVLARNALIFTALIEGWGEEVRDENGQPGPYSGDALAALIKGPDGVSVSSALNHALTEIRYGIAPAKNSPTSPEAGPAPASDEVTEAVKAS